MIESSQNKNEIKLEKEINLSRDFAPPTFAEWRATAEENLKGIPFEKALVTHTYEGIDLQPIYRKEDIENLPHLNTKPGFGNYARGTSAEGYLDQSWEICQAINFSLPEDFNKALKHALERGQTAIQLTPDRATLMGLDADVAEVGDVGAGGVSISNLEDLSKALKDIDLDKLPVHIDGGFSSLEILTLLVAFFKNECKAIDKIKGSIDTDPLGFMVTHGKLQTSLKKTYDNMGQVIRWAIKNIPQLKTIGISGVPYHNSGANAIQELAFTLATAKEYIDRLMERNLTIDDIATSMRFTFGIGSFYFMEVAKLRSARMLWSKIVEAYGGNKESQKTTIHGVTSFYNQTKYDPYVNMLRTTTEAFSAVISGVDSLQTNPFDETLGFPDEFSRRIALNTQIILNEEAHLNRLIDPAGGSYYVEKLTDKVAKEAWALFQEIERRGGMFKVLEEGYPQGEIEGVAEKRKMDLVKRKTILVGTNSFANVKEKKKESRVPDYKAIHKIRSRQLKDFRKAIPTEDKVKISERLSALTNPATEDIIKTGAEAFMAGATFGELFIASGTTESPCIKPLRIHRVAEIFEKLRDAVGAFEAKTGAKPRLFLANMGPMVQYKARADFTREFFEIGGFDVIYPRGFETPELAVKAAIESEAHSVVICSTDPTYPELVPAITRGLKEKNPDLTVILAGYPKDQVDAHKKTGVDEFIYPGSDSYQILSYVLKNIGILQ